MGKKSKQERLTAHAKFEQRHAQTKNGRNARPATEQFNQAMTFGMSTPRDLSTYTNIGIGTLERMQAGRIEPSLNQKRQIIDAATQMGWTPAVA